MKRKEQFSRQCTCKKRENKWTTNRTEIRRGLSRNAGVIMGRYEGYSVDIINEISQILGFNYTIKLVEDGAYGSYNKHTGKWNGMIGKEIQTEILKLSLLHLFLKWQSSTYFM